MMRVRKRGLKLLTADFAIKAKVCDATMQGAVMWPGPKEKSNDCIWN
ncbi:hypothetical protein [Segetibacter aerophilus]|nr:hypothetical protein [Segetibacter aerophilus]